jgi:hypothetical protein
LAISTSHGRSTVDTQANQRMRATTTRTTARGSAMNISEDQFQQLIAIIAQIEATGNINGQPTIGLAGAEEAFFAIQTFVEQLEQYQ